MTTATSETLVHVPDHVHTRAFDGELVILDLERGKYFALDEIGASLWQAMAAGASVGDAARSLEHRYDVAPEVLLADLVALCESWIERGLVEVRG